MPHPLVPRRRAALLLLACLASPLALAQTAKYPARPITILVGVPAGGAVDQVARATAQKLGETIGVSVLVDNRAGASGMIAADAVAKAAPDGYTLLVGSQTHLAVVPQLLKKPPFDPAKDLIAAAPIARSPLLLVVNNELPAKSVKDVIALARAKPGMLNAGSGGAGTTVHMAMELFCSMAQVNITNVSYKGEAPALTDLIGGQLSLMFPNLSAGLPFAKAGKIRAIAVTSAERSPAAPELPTIAESGLPGYDSQTWFGLFAPAGTPKEVVQRLAAEVAKMQASPEVKQRFAEQGIAFFPGTPESFGPYVKSEIAKWGKVIRDNHIQTD
ncbi:MAG TPA: tripartite tricarboxylate transporter substrate binding protein [Burkholderiales bacterium]|nr:tripartite tricarboxylate transporter substrate binding protein [Burkholderiales bacterium]